MIDKTSCSIGFVKGKGLISKGIVACTSPDSWTPSHVYIHKSIFQIIETHMFIGVRQRPSKIYENKDIKVYKPRFINKTIKLNMIRLAEYTLGNKYGMTKIPLFLLDSIFGMITKKPFYFFTRYVGISNFKVCSNHVAWLYYKTPMTEVTDEELELIAKGKLDHKDQLGYTFGRSWKEVTPNSMQNWCETHISDWEIL